MCKFLRRPITSSRRARSTKCSAYPPADPSALLEADPSAVLVPPAGHVLPLPLVYTYAVTYDNTRTDLPTCLHRHTQSKQGRKSHGRANHKGGML